MCFYGQVTASSIPLAINSLGYQFPWPSIPLAINSLGYQFPWPSIPLAINSLGQYSTPSCPWLWEFALRVSGTSPECRQWPGLYVTSVVYTVLSDLSNPFMSLRKRFMLDNLDQGNLSQGDLNQGNLSQGNLRPKWGHSCDSLYVASEPSNCMFDMATLKDIGEILALGS